MANSRRLIVIAFFGFIILRCTSIALPQGAQPSPVLRARTSLVLVPASPLDKQGKVVRGLKREGFRLLVDGKPVEIVSFDVVSVAGTSLVTATNQSPQGETKLTEKTILNIPAESSSAGNLVIFLIDFLNTAQADRMFLGRQSLKFFSNQLRPTQEVAVYGLTNSLVLIQPFTRDPSRLIAAARDVLLRRDMPSEPVESRPLGPEDGLIVLRRAYNIDQRKRALRTLAAFRQLANAYSGIPGKKSLIWLTGDASPLNPTLLYQFLQDKSLESVRTPAWDIAKTYEALNAANISVFPVDARGVFNVGLPRIDQNQSHTEFMQTMRETQPTDESPYSNMTDLLQGEAANAVLAMMGAAAETGGEVLRGSNDLGSLLDRAQQLWAYYYVLGFDPHTASNESEFRYHRIEVRVRGHVSKILARRGFAIRPAVSLASASEIQRDISEAAESPVDLTAVPLALTLGGTNADGKDRHIPFSLLVRGGGFALAEDSTGVRYDLSVATLVRDERGEIIRSAVDKAAAMVSPDRTGELKENGITFRGEFRVPAGESCSGRVIVRDNLAARIGTVTVQVPK